MRKENKFQYVEIYKKFDSLFEIKSLKYPDRIEFRSDTNGMQLELEVAYNDKNQTSVWLSYGIKTIAVAVDKAHKRAQSAIYDDGIFTREIFRDDATEDKELGQKVNQVLNNWLNDIKECGYKPIILKKQGGISSR